MAKLNWWNDQSQRAKDTSTQTRRPSRADQSHHGILSSVRRAVGGTGPLTSSAGEYPSFGRRPTPGARSNLRQRHILCAAHRLPVEGLGLNGHLLLAPRPTCAFKNGLLPGCSCKHGRWGWSVTMN